jgi:peptidoglycan/xylan/chitin deacetylase (PgdA/CDA1 family)
MSAPKTASAEGSVAELALRIDIDTFVGCRDGLPRLARELDACGVRATIFVVTGRDTSGRHVRRLRLPGYLKRLRALGIRRTITQLSLRTLLYGTVLPGPRVARENAALLRSLARDGHELGTHGDDHAAWAEGHESWSPFEVRGAWARSMRDFEDAVGEPARAGAAPNWSVSAAALEALDDLGMDYRSDTRGSCAFFPRLRRGAARTLQLPVTLPACHELLVSEGVKLEETPMFLAEALRPGALNVWCLHDWFEGLRAPWLVGEVVRAAKARGFRVVTLADIARRAKPGQTVPVLGVERRGVAGGVGQVSVAEAP